MLAARFALWGKTVFVLALIFGLLALPRSATARWGTGSIEIHNRDTYAPMPIKTLTAKTLVDGPVARTRITYLIENKNTARIEATVNLFVPENTVLTGFGYYYGERFIPGKMYDKDEAWKIYSAVTSRGRDPGIMDRPTSQEYHAQIFPVEPNNDLKVIIELTQAVRMDSEGSHLEVPITQGQYYGNRGNYREIQVEAAVTVRNHTTDEITENIGANASPEVAELVTRRDTQEGAYLGLRRTFNPTENWRLQIRRETKGLAKSIFSRMVGRREGYYALAISPPRELENPRLVLRSRPGTRHSMPNRFDDTAAYESLLVVGRYTRPQRLWVTVLSDNADPISLNVDLSGEEVESVGENPAAALWADKWIDALSNANRRDFRNDIIKLSQRFMVISSFTALLAIPQEELDYYRNVLAKQKVKTNTEWTGGGGGDPYIEVRAHADASRVTAIFPNGDIKELTFDALKSAWSGRFDIPFGTPEGDYRVTIVVVHKTGERTRFVLVYKNLLSAPQVLATSTILTAKRGAPLAVSVSGKGISRAVAVAPWGERAELSAKTGPWQGTLTVPATWQAGNQSITVVLFDGAHNRTEVTLDVDIE